MSFRIITIAAAVLAVGTWPPASSTAPQSNSHKGQPKTSRLAWRPPALSNPVQVEVSASHRWLTLRTDRDYVVKMPSRPLTGPGGLVVEGGHNVVLIGGAIDIPTTGQPEPGARSRRGLELKGQTGTVHIEGLLLKGAGLSEGIDIDERTPGVIVQLENIRINGLHAWDERAWSDNHPDLLQSWAGPAQLRVDGLTGATDYQAFYLSPRAYAPGLASPETDLRRVNVTTEPTPQCSGRMLWAMDTGRVSLDDFWVVPHVGCKSISLVAFPAAVWAGAHLTPPPSGDFVPSGSVGPGYVSPGYR